MQPNDPETPRTPPAAPAPDPPAPPAPVPAPKPPGYDLKPGERAVLMSLQQNWLLAKAACYDLEDELKNARAVLNQAQHNFDGGVAMLANANGIAGGKATNELDRIVPRTKL